MGRRPINTGRVMYTYVKCTSSWPLVWAFRKSYLTPRTSSKCWQSSSRNQSPRSSRTTIQQKESFSCRFSEKIIQQPANNISLIRLSNISGNISSSKKCLTPLPRTWDWSKVCLSTGRWRYKGSCKIYSRWRLPATSRFFPRILELWKTLRSCLRRISAITWSKTACTTRSSAKR